ncbi:MAG TPA: apolipoprotein N-acyltransferase [Terracidiphilus sp.]|nr:apolipoprotein N-acyltransferase [Terracidiphilus sp.]
MKLWAAAALSACLLELPFPLAGPMPPWRSGIAWFALTPLLWALLSEAHEERSRARSAFLPAYFCGFLWYMGNCYWVRDTMSRYGDMPPLAPTLLLVGFSLVLGLYFGLFGLCVWLVRRATSSSRLALAAAPVLWAALELAAARITSVPWDQLGYSQVDNGLVNQLAPWTGVYGISFVLVGVNALLAGCLLKGRQRQRWVAGITGAILALGGWAGLFLKTPAAPTTATAMLVQPNLDVGNDNVWPGTAWDEHIAGFTRLAEDVCKAYIRGIPQTGSPRSEIDCPPAPHPDLVVWPESPAPFIESEARFQTALAQVARAAGAPLVAGGIGMDYSAEDREWRYYNSAMVEGADGVRVGRYDKIHLVPFGEYVPFRNLLFFARKLTGRVSEFTRGDQRKVFRLNGHRYGIFICYEAVFADEVRQFSELGAEVLVNISDDGWYGDTSAPWQHLNMARMRAIENRRWLLRDTNNGVTAAIDPYGRVRQSIPRHAVDVLPAKYGFRDDMTFYTVHGDLFAWLCAILSIGIAGGSLRTLLQRRYQEKVRS